MVLPLPTEVSAVEVARIAQAAAMVRAREIAVSFAGDIWATMSRDVVGVDPVELEQDFGVTVFGFEVPLGVGHVRLSVVEGPVEAAAGRPDLVRVALRPLAADRVLFALTPPVNREVYKRTLLPEELPSSDTDAVSAWPDDWAAGEHQVARELRADRSVRFISEGAFFEWLAHPDAITSG